MRVRNSKGQTWSFDLIIAVVIFIIVVGVFYAILNRNSEGVVNTQSLEEDAKSISYQLNCDISQSDVCFIENGEINQAKLDYVASLPYDELKRKLGTDQDFCFYLVDNQDRIIPATPTSAGVGDGTYRLNQTIGCNDAP